MPDRICEIHNASFIQLPRVGKGRRKWACPECLARIKKDVREIRYQNRTWRRVKPANRGIFATAKP